LTSIAIIITDLLAKNLLLVMFLNSTSYTPDEIEWCVGNMPLVEIEVCTKEFGYYNNIRINF